MSKKSKELIVFLCLAGILFCAYKYYQSLSKNEEITGISALHVEDGKLKDENNDVIVLRGMSSHGLGWYPRYINANSLNSLKERGANVIRLAMYSAANDGYLEEPYNLDFMYIGIENAIAEDMYVIADWHILKDNNPLMHQEEAIAFFDELSATYKDTANLIYEICNEPNGDTTWEDIREYADAVIPVIRKNAPNSIILVGTPKHSTDIKSAIEAPLPYDNIMYTLHKYVDVSKNEKPTTYWLEKALKKQFPVFVSEWGIVYEKENFEKKLTSSELAWVNENLNLEPAYYFVEFMKENDISWCGWALSNATEIHASFKLECDKISGWNNEDMTPNGLLMFENFK